ncbi:unnamed protein product [Pleuronectes platessa]|uniref:Uncharacterized protein n=1 Tax=Pleuronectes platessa TaxID=8262 RepID=A0A9N7U6Q5_PLEPL|nr:unnamed protein product [Pleuronectes platessa]
MPMKGVSLNGLGPPPTIISPAPGRDGSAPWLALARELTGANASRARTPPSPQAEAWLREPQLSNAAPQWELAHQQHPSTLLSQRLEVSRGTPPRRSAC